MYGFVKINFIQSYSLCYHLSIISFYILDHVVSDLRNYLLLSFFFNYNIILSFYLIGVLIINKHRNDGVSGLGAPPAAIHGCRQRGRDSILRLGQS